MYTYFPLIYHYILSRVLQSHLGGPIILTKYVMQMQGYDPQDATKNVALMDEAYEEFVAYTFLDGADKSKYGKMMETLEGQYSFKQNQYPKTLEDAITALKAHKFDDKYHEDKKRKKKKKTSRPISSLWNCPLPIWKTDATSVASMDTHPSIVD